jgi:hypothetical protein
MTDILVSKALLAYKPISPSLIFITATSPATATKPLHNELQFISKCTIFLHNLPNEKPHTQILNLTQKLFSNILNPSQSKKKKKKSQNPKRKKALKPKSQS